MENVSLNPQTTVADLICAWPQVIPAFLHHQMNCVGCSMSAFETLEDAARIYEIDFDEFLHELKNRITIPQSR